MYSEIPQGSKVDIQGLRCHFAPEGYVYNIVTKQLEYRGVYSRSDMPEEQYWERIPLPYWFNETMKRWDAYDKKKKEDEPEFYDENLEAYKSQEWDRRLNGFWFMNFNPSIGKSQATYITGMYYMLLQWWVIDIGLSTFTIPHLTKFHFLQYCIEDPFCFGMIDITKRRFLKTFIGGLFVTERVSRTKYANGALQSKTGKDAKKLFAKAIVDPFRRLPRFFRPEYDMSLGVNPKTEMRFQKTNVRGKKAEDSISKDELNSVIDFESADAIAYDGQKIFSYFGDEWGKTHEANVFDRHEVIRYCLLDHEGRIVGKALYSTTVEKVESEKNDISEAAKQLWDASDQTNRQENGQTASGLYRFFQTADESKNFDKYGYPNVAKNIKEILADRDAAKHNLRQLSARIRKEPRTIEDAFLTASDKCIFNIFNIVRRERELKETLIYKRKILFERDMNQKSVWRDVRESDGDFYWRITYKPDDDKANKYIIENGIRKPAMTDDVVMCIDGYSNSQGGKYGSKASAWLGRRFNLFDPHNTGKAIGHLYGRPNVKEKLHEQVMLAAEYYGCLAWYEHNADDYLSYFRERGKIGYLGTYPVSTIDPTKRATADRYKGFPTTPFSLTKQVDTGIAYFENHIHLIDFEELLEDAKKFDPNDRNEFDTTVSFLMLLVCLTEPLTRLMPKKTPLIKVYPAVKVGAVG